MDARSMPAAEVALSTRLVHRLIADQHPDLAELGITVLANGWDNLVCRLGRDLLVRLPRRSTAAALLANEQRWLPDLAPILPLPVPAPVRTGHPAGTYPWPWSVVPYLPGQTAAAAPPDDPHRAALALAAFLAALHRPAPADAPAHTSRGTPLSDRAEGVLARLEHLHDPGRRAAALRIWHTASAAPPWRGPPVWLHGDLHPANILVDGARIAAVIDFGDITSGDPATDLAVAWMLLPAAQRPRFRRAHPLADDATWARARGWALNLALVFTAHSADNPLMARIGRSTLHEVLADAAPAH